MADRHQAPRTRADQTLTAELEKWAALPRGEANLRLVALLVASMAAISLVGWDAPNRTVLLRGAALCMATVHGIRHGVTIWLLDGLRDRGIAVADLVLRSYLEPMRVTHLDLAACWLAYVVLVPGLGL